MFQDASFPRKGREYGVGCPLRGPPPICSTTAQTKTNCRFSENIPLPRPGRNTLGSCTHSHAAAIEPHILSTTTHTKNATPYLGGLSPSIEKLDDAPGGCRFKYVFSSFLLSGTTWHAESCKKHHMPGLFDSSNEKVPEEAPGRSGVGRGCISSTGLRA